MTTRQLCSGRMGQFGSIKFGFKSSDNSAEHRIIQGSISSRVKKVSFYFPNEKYCTSLKGRTKNASLGGKI